MVVQMSFLIYFPCRFFLYNSPCASFTYLLILLPSFKRSPTAPVFWARSLPAKSTKLSLLTFSPLTCQMEIIHEYSCYLSMDIKQSEKNGKCKKILLDKVQFRILSVSKSIYSFVHNLTFSNCIFLWKRHWFCI